MSPRVVVEVRPPNPVRVMVFAVPRCAHRRVRFMRVYRWLAFYECLGCGRELRAGCA